MVARVNTVAFHGMQVLDSDLRRHDRLKLWTSGGGGYGDPQERPVGDVVDDVLNGKVSREAAQRDYGVSIEGAAAGRRGREGNTR